MSTHRLPTGRLVDALAVVLVAGQLVELGTSRPGSADVAVVLLIVLGTGALLLRRRVAVAAVILALGGFAALLQLMPSTLSTTFLSLLFVVAVCGSLSRLPAVLGLLGGWSVSFEGAWLDQYGAGLGDFAMSAALMTGLWVCGFVVARAARQTSLTTSRAEAAERSRREAAEHAVQQERDRMTRELHDVVAHGLTVLVVQSMAARQDLEDGAGTDQVVRRLRATEDVARESLLELRTLLGILGTREEGPTATGVAGIRALVSRLSTPDFPVDLHVDGDDADLGHGVDLAIYRTVQEGLTNAVRHGDRSGATVRLAVAEGTVRVVVENGLPDGGAVETLGSGRGLAGLRERVAQHDGTLAAGAVDGRFTLRSELPVPASEIAVRP